MAAAAAARSRLDDDDDDAAFPSGDRREDRLDERSGLAAAEEGAALFFDDDEGAGGEFERDRDPPPRSPRPRLELLLPRALLAARVADDLSDDLSRLDFSSALLRSLARYSSTWSATLTPCFRLRLPLSTSSWNFMTLSSTSRKIFRFSSVISCLRKAAVEKLSWLSRPGVSP